MSPVSPRDGANVRYRAQAGVTARRFQAETIILDFNGGSYFCLDDVGSRVWEHVIDGATAGEVIDRLEREYDVTRDRLAADVAALLDDLVARGLLSRTAE